MIALDPLSLLGEKGIIGRAVWSFAEADFPFGQRDMLARIVAAHSLAEPFLIFLEYDPVFALKGCRPAPIPF
jgi:hypothetical protein